MVDFFPTFSYTCVLLPRVVSRCFCLLLSWTFHSTCAISSACALDFATRLLYYTQGGPNFPVESHITTPPVVCFMIPVYQFTAKIRLIRICPEPDRFYYTLHNRASAALGRLHTRGHKLYNLNTARRALFAVCVAITPLLLNAHTCLYVCLSPRTFTLDITALNPQKRENCAGPGAKFRDLSTREGDSEFFLIISPLAEVRFGFLSRSLHPSRPLLRGIPCRTTIFSAPLENSNAGILCG